MKLVSDQQLARYMLQHRERGAYSILAVLRINVWRYLLFVLIVAAVIGLFSSMGPDIQPFIWAVVGLGAGALLRDLGWFSRIKQTWKFTEAVTDWRKVEALARGANLPDLKDE